MVSALIAFKRRADLSVEAFQSYWRGDHAAVVAQLSGIKRYVQSHPRLGGYRRGELAFDGVAQLWFDDVDTLREQANSAAYAAVLADEKKFLDVASKTMLLTDEHPIIDEPAPPQGVKNIEFLTRKPSMPVSVFQQYWRAHHGAIAAGIPGMRRYVQCHLRLGGYRGGRSPAYDGVAVTWFDSVDAMRASATSDAYRNTRADEANFLAPGLPPGVITSEHVVID